MIIMLWSWLVLQQRKLNTKRQEHLNKAWLQTMKVNESSTQVRSIPALTVTNPKVHWHLISAAPTIPINIVIGLQQTSEETVRPTLVMVKNGEISPRFRQAGFSRMKVLWRI